MDRKTGQDEQPKLKVFFESLQNDPSWGEIEETCLVNDDRNAVEWEKPQEGWVEEGETKPVRIYPFDAATIAGLLVVDLATLKHSVQQLDAKYPLPVEASRALRLGVLLKIFLTKNWGEMDEQRAELFFPDPDIGKKKFELEPPQLDRNMSQQDEHINLDNEACIISGTSHFDVCHVVPHSANKPKARWFVQKCLRGMMSFVDEDYHKATMRDEIKWDKNIQRTFGPDVGISDRLWNLVCLDNQLHEFWGKTCFALKCLGIIEAGHLVTEGLTTKDLIDEDNQDDTMVHLKLQFHWMPKRISKALLKPKERTKEAVLGQFDGTWGNPKDPAPRVAFYRSNGRLLRSGDIIRVAVKRRHCQKLKLAFDVQWALTKICALAGGADVLDEESPHCSDPWALVEFMPSEPGFLDVEFETDSAEESDDEALRRTLLMFHNGGIW
ncbi:hypothetical protein V8F33_002836 [Rhypophila sp. PSN 637]